MTRILKTILVFTGALSLVFLFLSCEAEPPEPSVNRVVKRPIKPEEIPFDPAVKWQSPSTPPARNDHDLFPEPYPDLNSIIDHTPAWDGGMSIWSPAADALETGSAPVSNQPKDIVQPQNTARSKDTVRSKDPIRPEVKKAVEPHSGSYVLLLGTFTRQALAEKEVCRFKGQGLPVFLDRFTYKKRQYFGVCYGDFPNRRQARQAGKDLTRQGRIDDFYVRRRPDQP